MIRRFDRHSIPKNPDLLFDWKLTGSRPVVLEVGCGDGEHAFGFAKRHPQFFVVALERTTNRFQSFSRRLENHPTLPNLFALQADAIHWCAHNLNKQFLLSHVYFLYPNPYPKEKQSNLRFVNMPFMGFLLQHLRPEGTVTLATNIAPHFQEARHNFVQHWGLEIIEEGPVLATSEPRTAFERKYLNRGETCYNLVLSKPLGHQLTSG